MAVTSNHGSTESLTVRTSRRRRQSSRNAAATTSSASWTSLVSRRACRNTRALWASNRRPNASPSPSSARRHATDSSNGSIPGNVRRPPLCVTRPLHLHTTRGPTDRRCWCDSPSLLGCRGRNRGGNMIPWGFVSSSVWSWPRSSCGRRSPSLWLPFGPGRSTCGKLGAPSRMSSDCCAASTSTGLCLSESGGGSVRCLSTWPFRSTSFRTSFRSWATSTT